MRFLPKFVEKRFDFHALLYCTLRVHCASSSSSTISKRLRYHCLVTGVKQQQRRTEQVAAKQYTDLVHALHKKCISL
jgi:hypothetical protein